MGETTVGLLTGLLFGLGLCLSGMADPSVVLGFLDLAGNWNPALLFVMAGGVSVTFIGYHIVFGRKHPLWSKSFQLPTATAVDTPLISGAAIFGVGWGLAGYCPGPALVSLASGRPQVLVFVVAMLTGMIFVRWMRARPRAAIANQAATDEV
jgi:uncharacterized membrane protein YedE/YeeE